MNKKPNVFRFKQFVIDDSQCAMKVGTDAIMLASWVSVGDCQRVLDIGTGSGVIAIMLAQKMQSESAAKLFGIDIDKNAIEQAKVNAQTTPWSNRLFFLTTRLQDYQSATKFDLIVSNPPFFDGNKSELHENNANYTPPERRAARQTIELSLGELIENVSRLLANQGKFYCVLPFERTDELIDIANQHNLYCTDSCSVKSTPLKRPKRSLLGFSRDRKPKIEQHILIRDSDNSYTPTFKQLCRDYYLNF